MHQHFITDRRSLYYTSVRSQVSFQNCKTTGSRIWIIDRTDYFRILIVASFYIFADCLSGNCHALCVEQSFFIQLIHNRIYAACLIEILDICMSGRSQMTEIRSFFADTVGKVNFKIHADFMGNGRDMKHAVCRASQRHINCKGIQNCLFCNNVSRTDILSHQFHHLHTGMFCQLKTRRIYSRYGSVSFQSHSQSLCQTIHAVCRIHT